MGEDNEETSQDSEDTAKEDTSSDKFEENQKNALKKFELVLVINLKEVSKCQSLRDRKFCWCLTAYDEYRCGSNSEIYEIFRGKKLRNCCVLITTRISKADELREFKDVHAEITGFSEEDREAFMRRMLGGKTEAKELMSLLSWEGLEDLARVPLLLLFFCTLWKKGNQGKHSPARFGKVEDFKEILAEIGKVALECLLKDDHVFEYDQLSAAILCEESLIIGLLQVSEYAEKSATSRDGILYSQEHTRSS
ncbi:Nlrc4p [Desmophyllum pertusum]|uniref:Nlrc4p n=1 Tax=Desmophyllum pertusum TaxID=174260 RepID=A0A9W9YZ24_9CNID|nr:Nlrc4p [Desmophyllum pertusum]